MLIVSFFSWWYVDGWKVISHKFKQLITNIDELFSVKLLLKTLFKPWKRIVTPPGNNLSAHFQSLIDNTVSRFIGFSVRIIVLCSALVSLILIAILGTLLILVWPLLPIAVVAFIILGVF